MSYLSAARFANWLNNGQPVGPQDLTTEDGAYFLDGNANSVIYQRRPGASWFLPTTTEWYKAAYFDPTDDSYWTWPTHSLVAPVPEPPPGGANSANVASAVGATTPIGAYPSSPGPTGTFDMGGNVKEMMQATNFANVPGSGGSYMNPVTGLRANSFNYTNFAPNSWYTTTGFRVVYVPEPSSAAAVGALACALARRRRQ
jgi:formylglycine-generating enzyme required for sulfatase activity